MATEALEQLKSLVNFAGNVLQCKTLSPALSPSQCSYLHDNLMALLGFPIPGFLFFLSHRHLP